MFGLKDGYIDFYTNYDLSVYRSVHYYGKIDSIKAIYRTNMSMKLKDRCIPIGNFAELGLKQIRIRCMEKYIITIFDECLSMK
jgi:hypothetical protein